MSNINNALQRKLSVSNKYCTNRNLTETFYLQVESSRRNSKRSSSFHMSGSSKARSSPSELPSQSCPSPPVLTRHHSGTAQASSSNQKQSSSTSKKINAKSHRKEYLATSSVSPGLKVWEHNKSATICFLDRWPQTKLALTGLTGQSIRQAES